MKRSLGKSSMSSLELLLDTICNMFVSIILITLLIVITTTENPLDQLAVDSGPDKEEIARVSLLVLKEKWVAFKDGCLRFRMGIDS